MHWLFSYFRLQFNLTVLAHLFVFDLKGTVQPDFWPPVFFHNLNLPGPLTNGLKYFLVWLRIRWVILILGLKKKLNPWRIKNLFYPRTFFKSEKCSPLIVEYESIMFLWLCPFKSLCKSGKKWLTPGVMSDSVHCVQYDTPGRFLSKIQINWRNLDQNRTYLTHYSVAQAGLNYEKNRSKILFDSPITKI